VPTIKTPEQAIVELGDRLLIFIFLGFLFYEFLFKASPILFKNAVATSH
jgi:hypothetical protein